jgi:GTPase SAR1 family protein
MAMNRIVIGLTGDSGSGKTTIANFLVEKGFRKISIKDKVREMSVHFFSDDDINKKEDAILIEMRYRGLAISPSYWLNLALISVSDYTHLIVIDDIHKTEAINGNIRMYQVIRPCILSHEDKIPNIEVILNDSDLDSLRQKIEILYNSI